MREPRPLHPAHLQVVGGELWVIDSVQPVAAVVDPGSAQSRRLVGWPAVPAAPHHSWLGEWRTLADGEGLWVQAGDGPPARVLPDGTVTVATVRTTSAAEAWRLAAAGPHGAWLVGPGPVQDLSSAADAPPPDAGWSRVLVAGPDGTVHDVTVQHAVMDAVGTADGVLLSVDTGRGERVDIGPGTWSWEPEPEWLLVPWAEPIPREVSAGSHAVVAPPAVPSPQLPGWSVLWHPGDDPDDDTAAAEPQRRDAAAGLDWRLGRDRSGGFPWTSVATGHDPRTGVERVRVPLGQGEVTAVLGAPEALFVVLSRRPGGAAVLRVDPHGAVTEVLGVGEVDISAHVRPLGPRPADHDSYVRYWAHTWTGDDGLVDPVHEDMTAARADVVGDWPETAIEVTFDWTPLPGRRLRRLLPLFDELGRHTPPEYSDVHLMEDLATGKLPPPGDAAGGVLDL